MMIRKTARWKGRKIHLDRIKSAASYSPSEIDSLIALFPINTPEYDYIIDRLYFHSTHDTRDWKNRTDADGYSIIPARQFYDSDNISRISYIADICR